MKKGNLFTRHLKEVEEGYFEHFLFAFSIACWIIILGVMHLIHSIFPFIFAKNASKNIQKIATVMQKRSTIRKSNVRTSQQSIKLQSAR